MSSDWSRRSVLATAGALGATALAPTASARVTTRMVVPSQDGFVGDDGDLVGYFVHLGGDAGVDTDPSDVDGCGFESWSPTELSAYDARLLDRLDQEHRETETKVHVAGNADVDTGTLWIVNRQVSCPDDHVGLEVEQVGAAVNVSTEESGDSTATEGSGPGFGPLAALGGVVASGVGWARRRANLE